MRGGASTLSSSAVSMCSTISLSQPSARRQPSTFEQDDYIFGALRAGASGFLLKRARPEELLAAVHAVAAGDSLLSPSVTRTVIERLARGAPDDAATEPAEPDGLADLTAREREVLDLSRAGCRTRRSRPPSSSRSRP